MHYLAFRDTTIVLQVLEFIFLFLLSMMTERKCENRWWDGDETKENKSFSAFSSGLNKLCHMDFPLNSNGANFNALSLITENFHSMKKQKIYSCRWFINSTLKKIFWHVIRLRKAHPNVLIKVATRTLNKRGVDTHLFPCALDYPKKTITHHNMWKLRRWMDLVCYTYYCTSRKFLGIHFSLVVSRCLLQ